MWFLFMVHMCKMISPGIFSFKILKKWKSWMSCTISQEPYTIWLPFLVQKCKMISPVVYFSFFKILIFWVVMRVKEQKMAQNDKKLSVVPYSQKSKIIWSSFMVHLCKRTISPISPCFFQILISRANSRGKGEKCPEMTKHCLSHSIS